MVKDISTEYDFYLFHLRKEHFNKIKKETMEKKCFTQ